MSEPAEFTASRSSQGSRTQDERSAENRARVFDPVIECLIDEDRMHFRLPTDSETIEQQRLGG